MYPFSTQTLPIPLGCLVLLSGPPGCGKSTACAALPPSLIVSSDDYRSRFFGMGPAVVDGQVAERPLAVDDGLVFSVMGQVVRSRLKAGLTTIVDATLISDKERKPFAEIAETLGVPIQVIIFDLPEDQLRRQNQNRRCAVPDGVLTQFLNRLQRDSRWPYQCIPSGIVLEPQIPTIPDETLLDVIGDVHGLADGLRALLTQLGYDESFQHPQGRKLCFLGDLVDRGPQSLEVLDRVMAAVSQGHYCLRGNHDHNLLRGLRGENVRSRATRETLHFALQQTEAQRQTLIRFISNLPTFYRYQNRVLCHGDIEWFDPLLQPGHDRVYGRCRVNESHDTDSVFRQTSTLGLVRGHIPLTSPEEPTELGKANRIYSLEEGAGFGGPLVALQLPEETIVRMPCGFDYSKKPASLADRLENLVGHKLVKRVNAGPLTLYKYTSRAFYTASAWERHPELKLARGVVVGLHGEPISFPFPRTFNYREQGTTLPLDKPVTAIEKLNGFLVTTFLHPYHPSEVVVTCSGSFEGEYVERAKALLYREGLYGRVIGWLRAHPGVTLLWEAIHQDDPHIIQYSKDQEGLHLIGAGQASQRLNPQPLHIAEFYPEADLDVAATTLQVARPHWFEGTFGEAIAQVRTVNHEGFMIRLGDGSFALKLKSPYYLRTKFLARMTEKKSRFMFSSPDRFKQELDEELWPLVDWVTAQVTLDTWLTWSDVERRDLVQGWMEQFLAG